LAISGFIANFIRRRPMAATFIPFPATSLIPVLVTSACQLRLRHEGDCCDHEHMLVLKQLVLIAAGLSAATVLAVYLLWLAPGAPYRVRRRIGLLALVMATSIGFLVSTAVLLSDRDAKHLVLGSMIIVICAYFHFSRPVTDYYSHIAADRSPILRALLGVALGAFLWVIVATLVAASFAYLRFT
jgi:hypothetical protein